MHTAVAYRRNVSGSLNLTLTIGFALSSANWQEAHLESLTSAGTEQELFDALAKIGRELGFDYCAYGMRMPLPLSNPKMFMLNNYTSDWQARYVQENYLAVDPTVSHGLKSVLPLVWSETMIKNAMPFWDDARDHGLRVGWAQSSFDAKGVVGMLTLARSGQDLSVSELSDNSMKMSWLVHAAHNGMTRLLAAKNASAAVINLTSREVEVLRWTADGKTSSEVGEIMNISERTVNFHVNNSLEKLGAANKTAGVLMAAMLRLL